LGSLAQKCDGRCRSFADRPRYSCSTGTEQFIAMRYYRAGWSRASNQTVMSGRMSNSANALSISMFHSGALVASAEPRVWSFASTLLRYSFMNSIEVSIRQSK